MVISYDFSIEDAVAFNRYTLDHSPTIRRQRHVNWGCLAVILVVVTFLIGANDVSKAGGFTFRTIAPAACGFVFAVFGGVGAMMLVRKMRIKMIRRTYSEGPHRRDIGPRQLEVTQDGLIERNNNDETKVFWRGIDRFRITDDHVFIYLGPTNAFVIPRRDVPLRDVDALLHTIKTECSKPPPIAPPSKQPVS